MISPAFGIAFLIPNLGRICYSKPGRMNNFVIAWLLAIISAVFFKILDPLTGISLAAGVGFTVYVILKFIDKEFFLQKALIATAIIHSGLSAVKFYYFSEVIKNNLELSVKSSLDLLLKKYPANSTDLLQITEFIKQSKSLYLNYNYTFSVFFAILMTFVGIMFLKHIKNDRFELFFVPNYLAYILIIGLVSMVFPQTRYTGENILIPVAGFFFIQGLAVTWFYYGKLLRSSLLLIILFSLALVLNPYLVILIAIVGIVDFWFDLRKLNKLEETHENNIN
jgi:hypothetical protein